MLLAEPFTDRVTGLAIEVHRHAAGLLEFVYEPRLSWQTQGVAWYPDS